MHLAYRREIDGLRAIAVVPVILFHADITAFGGGFVGVDVFFVISGYLITSIILRELSAGQFSLLKFYERRARRILPALFVVMLACIPFAWMLMPPDQLNEFSYSLGAVTLFASNFLFWFESDYFANASNLKPLLHTWSLAVEEQYYILFPLILILVRRTKATTIMAVIACLLVASLCYAEYASRYFPAANFYLFPSRAWELLVGSSAAVLTASRKAKAPQTDRAWFHDSLAGFGLVMVLYPIFFYTEQIPFPGVYAIAPTVGTALILLHATSSTIVGRLLSLRPFVGIGLVSYSAYLWHQPVLAFARLTGRTVDDPSTFLLLLSIIFALAYLTWRFVEGPFRNRNEVHTGTVVLCAGAGSSVMLAIALFGTTVGFEFRYLSPAGQEFLKSYNGRALAIPSYRPECDFYLHNEISAGCLDSGSDGKPTTLVWGDSHAQALAAGLRADFGEKRFFAQVATSGCRPQVVDFSPDDIPRYPENNRAFTAACRKSNATVLRFLQSRRIESVIIDVKAGHRQMDWTKIVETIRLFGVKRIFLVGPVPQWDPSLPFAVAAQMDQIAPVPVGSFLRQAAFEDNDAVKRIDVARNGIDVVKLFPIDSLCMSRYECAFQVPEAPADDTLIVFDYGHLSASGSRYLARRLFSAYFD